MKNKSYRRRTKIVRRSKKNLRRTVRRKSLAKGRRRPTRRHSRIQMEGGGKFLEVGEHWEYAGDKRNSVYSPVDCYNNAINMYFAGAKMEDSDGLRCAYRLGDIHYKGKNHSGEPNYEKAFNWYSRAVSIGDKLNKWVVVMVVEYAAAQNNLGLLYEQGHGVRQDYAEAVKQYRLAADQGNADAQVNLAKMYEDGRGVKPDD